MAMLLECGQLIKACMFCKIGPGTAGAKLCVRKVASISAVDEFGIISNVSAWSNGLPAFNSNQVQLFVELRLEDATTSGGCLY